LHKKLDDSIAQNELILKQQEVILKKLEPVDSLTGFWKVLGFLLGAIGLLAAGVAGFKFLAGLLPVKAAGAMIIHKQK